MENLITEYPDLKTRPYFRASECYHLAARGRTKAPSLTQGAKTYIREVFLRTAYGYQSVEQGKAQIKGIEQETEALALYAKVKGLRVAFKNPVRQTKGYLTGEADLVVDDLVVDVKTSWDAKTFINADLSKQYEYQLRAYMLLYDLPRAELAYCLVDHPPELLQDEIRKALWQHNILDEATPEGQEIAQAVIDRFQFSHREDMPPELRVKTYQLERDTEKEALLLEGVDMALEYYAGLTLNFKP